jgi:thiazole/oxazole-forming peptide maturase SagD family component
MGSNPKLTFYPYGSHLLNNVLKPVCSEHGGIARSLLITPLRYADDISIKTLVTQMPAYHKVLLGPQMEINYHLSGYGMFFEEALIRLVGESIERYSLLIAPYVFSDRICYASYDDIAQTGRVIPIQYLQLYSDEDYRKLNSGLYTCMRRPERDDIIGWIKCQSLFECNTEIWVPVQMLFVGYQVNHKQGEVAFCPGFSTGTAAHTDFLMALRNALLESIEIDALMLRWYADMKARAVVIDELTTRTLLPDLFKSNSHYQVLALDIRVLEEVQAHVLASIVINKREARPFITLGAHADLEPVHALYRSLMEALAISVLGIYGPLYLPKQFMSPASSFTDLDSNVAFFASPDNAQEKRQVIEKLVDGRIPLSAMQNYDTGDTQANTTALIEQLSKVSQYGVSLDITPPETRSRGWKVMRVFVPELVTMCVPGVPYGCHPRLNAYGGIRNRHPHPLP